MTTATAPITALQLAEAHAERLAAVTRPAEGWPLDDAQTLRDLRAAFQADEELAALGTSLRRAIDDAGVAVLRGVPVTSDAEILVLFQAVAAPSAWGNGDGIVHTVAPRPAAEQDDLSETDREFPLHTDSTFLREPHHLIALACVERDADSGGESSLLSADHVRRLVRDELGQAGLDALSEPAYPFHLQDPLYGRGTQFVPILPSASGISGVRYRRDVLEELVPRHAERCRTHHRDVLGALHVLLEATTDRLRLMLDPGDMLVFDNRRFLHARDTLKPGAVRVLRRLKGYAYSGVGYALAT